MQYLKLFEQFIAEIRMQPIKGTPFQVYYGGKDVEGQLKWVIDSDDEEILNSYLEDEDQLWYNKAEAESVVKNWWKKNSSAFESFELKLFEEFINEGADYEYLVDLLLNAKPAYNVYYDVSHDVVNIGGTGYSEGDLVKQFKGEQGFAWKIKNNFYYAQQDPKETKKQIEKLSKGKIQVDNSTSIVKYKVK